jgi:hypothetical protein
VVVNAGSGISGGKKGMTVLIFNPDLIVTVAETHGVPPVLLLSLHPVGV